MYKDVDTNKVISGKDTVVRVDFENYPELLEEIKTFGIVTMRDKAHAIIALLSEKFVTGLHKAVLITFGERKIACIKALRNLTGLGLKEAKEAIDEIAMGKPLILTTGSYKACMDVKNEFEQIEGVVVAILNKQKVREHIIDSATDKIYDLMDLDGLTIKPSVEVEDEHR